MDPSKAPVFRKRPAGGNTPSRESPGSFLAGTVQLDPLPVHAMIWKAVFMENPLRIQ